MKNKDNIIWGILLVVLGVIFGLNAIGLTEINIFFDGWWTLIIIAFGLSGLYKDSDKTWPAILTLIGVVMLLAARNLIDFTIVWKLLFPSILVVFGISLVFKGFTGRDIKDKIKNIKIDNKDILHIDAVFSQEKMKIEEEFSGSELNAVFGNLDLNLKNAKLKNDAFISASSIFGGITLYLPENVNLVVNSTNVFGGIDNKYLKKSDAKITIYITATCLFGGIEIK